MPNGVGSSTGPAQAAPVQHRAPATQPNQGVRPGICAAARVAPAFPNGGEKRLDRQTAQVRAKGLIEWADCYNQWANKGQNDRLNRLSSVDQIFNKEHWVVRHAMRANPDFIRIVEEAAGAFVSGCLKDKNGNKTLQLMYQCVKDLHPELAAAFVVAAAPKIFAETDAIFTADDKLSSDLQALKARISNADSRAHQVVREANQAIAQLQKMVHKSATKPGA